MAGVGAGCGRWLWGSDGRPRRGRLSLAVAGFYLLFVVTYLPINSFSAGRRSHILYLPGEEQLPFLPIFEYLYVLAYFMPVLLIFSIRDYSRYQRLVRAFLMTLAATYTTYLLYPVKVERPNLVVDSLHTWLLSIEYMDKPYNNLPSLHVALSWLAVHAVQVSAPVRVGLAVVAIGISVSTIFIKQHYIVDVLSGFAISWIAWAMARGRDPKSQGAATA